MAELATLAMVKARLGIAASDLSRDDDLTTLLNAANAYVLRRTRYSLEDATVTNERHANIREGTTQYTGLRPIDLTEPITARGRVLGATDWTTLTVDVIDADKGEVKLVGETPALRVWPPPASSGGFVSRWRQLRWPIVEWSYSVTEIAEAVVAELASAAADVAAHMDSLAAGDGATSETVGQVMQAFASGAAVRAIPIGATHSIEGHVYPRSWLAG